jgi:hypothetical protein
MHCVHYFGAYFEMSAFTLALFLTPISYILSSFPLIRAPEFFFNTNYTPASSTYSFQKKNLKERQLDTCKTTSQIGSEQSSSHGGP